uniref:Uncharacterized protein n=1 Tax=Romanomermis culicivorax TaxID=13658 RepID=A0A915HQI0_ROMCU
MSITFVCFFAALFFVDSNAAATTFDDDISYQSSNEEIAEDKMLPEICRKYCALRIFASPRVLSKDQCLLYCMRSYSRDPKAASYYSWMAMEKKKRRTWTIPKGTYYSKHRLADDY